LKRILWVAILGIIVASVGWVGTNAYTDRKIEKSFPYIRDFYSNGDRNEIRNGQELVLLRNPGTDLNIRMSGTKSWNPNSLVRIKVSTETKEIGTETIRWPYWRKSFQLDSKRMDPDSFVKIAFQFDETNPIRLTGFDARTNRNQPKLLIFGFDGAGMNLLQPLIDAGHCPNFKKLMQTGSYGDLLSEEPAYSPVIWTTIATGRPPDDHGITFFLARTQPETSNSIKVKRFWEILSQYSALNSMILGWYLTWPVEDLQGGLISDRAYYNFKTKNLSFPPGMFDAEFQEMFKKISEAAQKDLLRFTSFPYHWDWKKRFAKGSMEWQNSSIVHQRLAHVYRRDSAYANFGLKAMRTLNPDILAVYLRGVDFTSHAFWKFRFPEQVPFLPVSKKEQDLFRNVIERYYIYLDEILGKYLAQAGEDATVIILSDHGFQSIPKEEAGDPALSGSHTLNGIIFCKGPQFKQGYRIPKASIYDFLPTLLYILGFPQASDMPGRVLTDAIVPEFVARTPLKKIKTYGVRTGSAEKSSERIDEEIKEELRILGYIQ
jgi:hypothetical protein